MRTLWIGSLISLLTAGCGGESDPVGRGGAGGGGGAEATGDASTPIVGPDTASGTVSPIGATSTASSGAGPSDGTAVLFPADGEIGIITEVAALPDGGWVAAGSRADVPFVARLAADGQVTWSVDAGPDYTGYFSDIVLLPDGGMLLGGELGLFGSHLATIVRLSAEGETLWMRRVLSNELVQYAVGGLVVHDDEVWLNVGQRAFVALSLDGVSSTRTTVDTGTPLLTLSPSADGSGVYLFGAVPDGSTFAPWVARMSWEREIVWQQRYDAGYVGFMGSAAPDGGASFLVLEESGEAVVVTHVDSDGAVVWSRRVALPGAFLNVSDIAFSGSDLVIVGFAFENETDSSMLQIRVSASGEEVEAYRFDTGALSAQAIGVKVRDGRTVSYGMSYPDGVVLFGDETGHVGGCPPGAGSDPSGFQHEAAELAGSGADFEPVEDIDFVIFDDDDPFVAGTVASALLCAGEQG